MMPAPTFGAVARTRPTLIGVLWPSEGRSVGLRNAVLVVVGSLLLALSAKLQVPFWPVPMTMQTFVVLVLGMAYGWRLAGGAVLLYLAEGAVGLPVFASGSGILYMAGPTGGFLVGFLAAVALLGWLAERGWDRSLVLTGAAMIAGHAVILGCGVAWLAHLFGWAKAVQFGLTPFWAATVLKTALGVAVMPAAWNLLRARAG
jgi:biotin transport system substrate-specific component